jgi:hypothetical protein
MSFDNDETLALLKGLAQPMQAKGLLPPGDLKPVIEGLKKTLDDLGVGINPEDMRDAVFVKKMQLGLMATCMQQNNPTFQFDFGLLFTKGKLNDDETIKLQMEIKNLLKACIKLNPKMADNEEALKVFDEALTNLAIKMTENMLLKPKDDRYGDNEKNSEGMQQIVSGLGNILEKFSTPGVLGTSGKDVFTSLATLVSVTTDIEKLQEDTGVYLGGTTPTCERK